MLRNGFLSRGVMKEAYTSVRKDSVESGRLTIEGIVGVIVDEMFLRSEVRIGWR